MKIIFMGTPDFSSAVLEKLNENYPVSAVVTGTDKAAGRGNKIRFSPVKERALALGIPVLQYDKVSKEGIEEIRALAPDIIVTAAFGQILSTDFLAVPKYGVLNVHASLLPKLRGASPIQWAVLNGDKTTGITIMRTVKEVDAGDILLAKTTEIGERETAGELFDRLSLLGGEAIVEAIARIERGDAVFTPQNHAEATYCGMIKKSDGKLDFDRTAHEIDCFVRGMTPWPSAYFSYDDKTVKVYGVKSSDLFREAEPGTILAADAKDGLIIKCADGAVRICELLMEGSRRMKDSEFLKGHSIAVGTVIGG